MATTTSYYPHKNQAGNSTADILSKDFLRLWYRYGKDKNEKIISGIKRISKPGLRVYADKENLPKVLGGLGTAILSTNQGVITDKEARKLGVGGEVLAFVW